MLLTRYPETSLSLGGVQATSKLSDPTLLVIRKFCGGINVGVILLLTTVGITSFSSWKKNHKSYLYDLNF